MEIAAFGAACTKMPAAVLAHVARGALCCMAIPLSLLLPVVLSAVWLVAAVRQALEAS
ncbi:MAG: hypothetical protein PF501_14010 [Salinisphaera sp.]|jgi:hypothetical protein|nr:hypothetical protein [Salinisphaera sp.]